LYLDCDWSHSFLKPLRFLEAAIDAARVAEGAEKAAQAAADAAKAAQAADDAAKALKPLPMRRRRPTPPLRLPRELEIPVRPFKIPRPLVQETASLGNASLDG